MEGCGERERASASVVSPAERFTELAHRLCVITKMKDPAGERSKKTMRLYLKEIMVMDRGKLHLTAASVWCLSELKKRTSLAKMLRV